MKHRSWRSLLAGAVVLVLVAGACGGDDDDDGGTSTEDTSGSTDTTEAAAELTGSELVVGVVGVGGGNATAGGQATTEAEDSIEAWVQWTNANGGINGHPVRAIFEATAGDPAKATAAVRKLVEEDDVLAILAQSDSATGASWADYAAEQEIPVIGGQNYTATDLTNPMWFMQSTTVLNLLYGQIAKFKIAGATTYGALSCTEAAACAQAIPIVKDKAPKAGVEFVFDQLVSSTQPDYTAACVAADDAGVEGLQLNGVPVDRIARDCARQGFEFVYGIVSEAEAQLEIPELEGAVGNLPAFPAFSEGPETEDFHAAMEEYMPDLTPSVLSSQTWLAGLAFAKALEGITPEQEVTRQDVLDGLYQIKDETFGGLTPPISYGPAGGPNPAQPCYYIFQIEDGAYVAPNGLEPECEPEG